MRTEEFTLTAPPSSAVVEQQLAKMRTRAVATRNKRILRRAKSEAVLADILPAELQDGYSYHVISHGDIDALSYLAHCVKTWPFDYVFISTWCMAMADVDQLIGWLHNGRIGELDFCCGEIFPTQYPDETDKLFQLEAQGEPVSVKIARNHAKIMLASNADEGVYLAFESSANVNTNPRIEQTTITRDRDLFEFYREFYAGIQTVYKNPHAPRYAS